MGSPTFAIPSLIQCHQHFKNELVAVMSQPDAKKGRGLKQSPTPVKEWALSQNYPVHTPSNANDCHDIISKIDPDLIIVAAYGMFIPASITERYYCLNIHPSLLPKYRGASPIQSCLLNLETETGLTLMKVSQKMDAGDLLYQEPVPIHSNDNALSLSSKLAALSATRLIEFIKDRYIPDQFQELPQIESQATFCHKLNREDREIQVHEPTEKTLGKIKAFSPKPGAFIMKNKTLIKILDAEINEENQLVPTQVQPEGKSAMSYHDYCLGHPEGIQLC